MILCHDPRDAHHLVAHPVGIRMRLTCNQCMFNNIAVLGFFGIVLLIEGLIGTI